MLQPCFTPQTSVSKVGHSNSDPSRPRLNLVLEDPSPEINKISWVKSNAKFEVGNIDISSGKRPTGHSEYSKALERVMGICVKTRLPIEIKLTTFKEKRVNVI